MINKPRFVEAGEKHLVQNLIRLLGWADSASLCVSYARYDAFRLLEKSFTSFLKRGGKLRVIFDIERYFTDPEIINEFSTIPGNSECRVFFRTSNSTSGPLHAKVYLFQKGTRVKALLGSSNFTIGGLSRNLESNVILEGNQADQFFKTLLKYFDQLWNSPESIRPEQNYDILELYEKFKREDKKKIARDSKQEKLRQRIFKQAFEQAKREFQSILRNDTAYLLGLVAGGGIIKDHAKPNVIVIKYHRGVFNRGKKDEGYITAKGISNIRLKQKDAFRKDIRSIIDHIKRVFKDLQTQDRVALITKSDFDYEIVITFAERSKLFPLIKEYLNSCSIVRGRVIPVLPESLREADKELLASFLRGYGDIRMRIRPTDREGTQGPLRVAISFSRGAETFAKELYDLLKKKFGIVHLNLLPGPSRERETMLRIDPVDLIQIKEKIFSTHDWKLRLINDFASYNKKRFAKRYSPV